MSFIRHLPCPSCGSSDALSEYTDNYYCFVCGYYESKNVKSENKEKPEKREVMPPLSDRGLSKEAVSFYEIKDNEGFSHAYPYKTEDGTLTGTKFRYPNKEFAWEGKGKEASLFGIHLFPRGSNKSITVVEGELDAAAAYQMSGSKYPVVAVQSASTAKRDCTTAFEYLDSFEKIVLAFDSDAPGRKAAEAVAQLFKPGKVYICDLRLHKDPCDYLKNGDERAYVGEWFKAKSYTPEGLRLGPELWDEIENHKDLPSVPYPWGGLNYMLYGLRLSEAVIFTADTGIGKTSILKEIEYSLLTNPELISSGAGVGFLHLEETNYDTALGLMSIDANKPFHLPDTEKTTSELRSHYDAVINSPRVVIYDHFGSNDIEVILSKIRHMAALGCKYIFLDHLSIIVSDHSGDERKELDEISTKLKMLCMSLDICVVAVIHQNRSGSIRGSAGVEQLANSVIKLYREKTDRDPWRRNVTEVVVEKNRFSGRCGRACLLWYNEETGRLQELSKEEEELYDQGLSPSIEMIRWDVRM